MGGVALTLVVAQAGCPRGAFTIWVELARPDHR